MGAPELGKRISSSPSSSTPGRRMSRRRDRRRYRAIAVLVAVPILLGQSPSCIPRPSPSGSFSGNRLLDFHTPLRGARMLIRCNAGIVLAPIGEGGPHFGQPCLAPHSADHENSSLALRGCGKPTTLVDCDHRRRKSAPASQGARLPRVSSPVKSRAFLLL